MIQRPSGRLTMLDPAGRDSFESFFREHYASVVRALVVVSGDEAEAQDLAQEAFARALELWERVRSMESPLGYVYRIAFNLNILASRRRKHSVLELAWSDNEATQGEQVANCSWLT